MLGGYWESVSIFLGINALMALSVYVPLAAGLISLGQGGFMAIGAYTSAVMTKAGYPFALALPAGALLAAIAGLIVGAPALRVRGMYLMILTLGFGEIVRVFFLNFEPTGGPSGLGGIRPLTELWQVIVACLVTFVRAVAHPACRLGRAMIAVHEDDLAAEAMGINLLRIKLLSFSLGRCSPASPAASTRIRRCSSTPTSSIFPVRPSPSSTWSSVALRRRSAPSSARRS